MRVNPTTSVATRLMSIQEPMSSVGRGSMSCSREETSSTSRTAMKRTNTTAYAPHAKHHHTRAANSRHGSESIRRNLTTPRLLRPISPRSLMLSSVTFLWKAAAQGMTARMFHIVVSRLANWFCCMYYGS